MDFREYFTIETQNNLSFEEYLNKIDNDLGQDALHLKHSFQNTVMDNNYDHIVLNQIILKKDFYLDINFVLGGSKEYLKLNGLIFASSDKKINEAKNKLEKICEVKHA